MDGVVHRPDHEDTEKHSVGSEGRDKAADAGDDEKETEDNGSGFKHGCFLWFNLKQF